MRAEKNRGGQGWQRGSGQREVDKWRGQSKRTGMAKGGRAKEDRHAEGGSPEGQAGQGKRVVWRSERGERPGRLGRASGEGLAGKTGGTDRRPVPGKCRQAGGVIPGREGAERERQDRRGEAGKLGEAGQTGKGRTDGERQANAPHFENPYKNRRAYGSRWLPISPCPCGTTRCGGFLGEDEYSETDVAGQGAMGLREDSPYPQRELLNRERETDAYHEMGACSEMGGEGSIRTHVEGRIHAAGLGTI